MAAALSGQSLDETAAALVALANDRGGPDNITVLLARVMRDA
jgi:serine/threonine protein phosphatase PrpC